MMMAWHIEQQLRLGKATLCVAGALACAIVAGAQDSQPSTGDLPPLQRILPRYELQVSIGAWVPRLSGEVALGNTDDHLSFEDDLDLFQSEGVFNAELALRKDQTWEIAFGGFDFGTDSTVTEFDRDEDFGDVAIREGDEVRSNFDLTSFWTEIVPWAWRAYDDDDPNLPDAKNLTWDGRYIVDLRLMPRLGIRTLDLEQTMENLDTGQRQEIEAAWLAIYGGLAAEMQYRPQHATPMLDLLEIELGLNAGPALGNDGGFMTEVRAGINWHFHPNAGATVGYRLVSLFVEDDQYDLDATLAGLYVAASIRF